MKVTKKVRLLGRDLTPLIYISTAVVTSLLLPITTTWDGILYLGSGEALLHGGMQQQYHWLRDPLYPLLVGALNDTGFPQLFTFVQSMLLLLGVHLIASTLATHISATKRPTPVITLLTYLFIAGFASSILQQSLIVFLSGAFISVTFRVANLRSRTLGVTTILFLMSLTSTVVALGALFVFILTLLVDQSQTLKARVVSTTSAVMIVACSLGLWTAYKAQYASSPSLYAGQRYFWEMDGYNDFSFPDKILAIPSSVMALNSVGIEFYYDDFVEVGAEARLFGTPVLNADQACGRTFPGPEAYLAKARLAEPSYCVSTNTLAVSSALNAGLSFFLPFASLIGLVATFMFAFRHFRTRAYFSVLALLSGQLLLIPFWFGNVAISRLGLVALVANLVVFFIYTLPKITLLPHNFGKK